MNTLTLHPDSSIIIDNPILGKDNPILVAIKTPVICTVLYDDTLAIDKKSLLTQGREIRLTIQY